MSSKLVKGTAILTIGLFLSKALGLLYFIPFYAIVGKENMGLYQYAYIPYNIALVDCNFRCTTSGFKICFKI